MFANYSNDINTWWLSALAMKNIKINVAKVFVNENGEYGNPVGMIVDEKKELNNEDRQKIATRSGFSECVFINDLKTGMVSIFNPQSEIDFSGHALLGAAYFLRKRKINNLQSKVSKIINWLEDDLIWIKASVRNLPPWNFEELNKVVEVENLSRDDMKNKKHIFVWSWLNAKKGIIKARTFAYDWGIVEDEANGSGATKLAAKLKKKLEIHHGKGSVIYSKALENDFVTLGGRVLFT